MYVLIIIIIYFIFVFCIFNIHESFTSLTSTIYNNNLYINPAKLRDYSLRKDVIQNRSSSVQPKSLHHDIFDSKCVISYKRPAQCLSIKGNYINKIQNKNCNLVCPNIFSEEEGESIECFTDKNKVQTNYWCNRKCGCKKYKYDPINPSNNNCGNNGISQYPVDVYLTEDECKKNSKPCDGLNENDCRNTSGCGYCRNNIGQGQCFSSTTEGPLDVTLPCIPDRMKPTNSFSLGRSNPFVGISQFLPDSIINNNRR